MDLDKFFQETNFEDVEKRVEGKKDVEASQPELGDDGDCDGCKI